MTAFFFMHVYFRAEKIGGKNMKASMKDMVRLKDIAYLVPEWLEVKLWLAEGGRNGMKTEGFLVGTFGELYKDLPENDRNRRVIHAAKLHFLNEDRTLVTFMLLDDSRSE